jgi:ubiquinone/menaquinone biosynthesis C-methylase UbiE
VRLHSHSRAGHDDATPGHVIHWAPAYDFICGRFIRRTHAAVVELAAPTAGERVLDFGCGPGSLTIALKAAVGPTGSAHGIDAATEMIDVARRNALEAGAEVDFQVGLAEAMPFPDGTFDLAVSQLAIHHLPGDLKPRAFAEMARVLKPGGRCLIIDFEPPKTGWRRVLANALLGPEMMHTDVRDYRDLLARAGFRDLETGRTRHRLLSFVRGRTLGVR